MPAHVLPGEPPVPVALRRHAGARRLSLRVSGADGRATLTFPRRTPLREALAFLRSREGWLRAQMGDLSGVVPAIGGTIPFDGCALILEPAPGRRIVRDGERLLVPEDRFEARLLAWLKLQARARAIQAVERHAGRLGVACARLALADPRSRWGSCSASGRIMLSWRLVMAPPGILDYVAAHEVAHLVHLDHSPAFWAVVERLRPDWREARDWLRAEGAGLHRVRLGGGAGGA